MRMTKEQSALIKSYVVNNPESKKYTLAKRIYEDNPILFSSIKQIRDVINHMTGSKGKLRRETIKDKSLLKPLTFDTTNTFKELISRAPALKIFKLPKEANNILFLSDIHFPYQDNDSLILALNYGIENNVNCIWLNGDIMDMFQASSHEKLPNKETINDEFEMVRGFLYKLRKTFPNAYIYYKEGNHEMRWDRLLMRKAPELIGCSEFELPVILRLAEYNVKWISNRTLVKFGKLNVIHGNEFKGGGGVNPARSLYLRAKSNCIAGDKHKSGENNEGTLNGDLVTTWSVGCLCDLNPEYMPLAHTIWNHGFAHIKTSGEMFSVSNKRIHNGTIL